MSKLTHLRCIWIARSFDKNFVAQVLRQQLLPQGGVVVRVAPNQTARALYGALREHSNAQFFVQSRHFFQRLPLVSPCDIEGKKR